MRLVFFMFLVVFLNLFCQKNKSSNHFVEYSYLLKLDSMSINAGFESSKMPYKNNCIRKKVVLKQDTPELIHILHGCLHNIENSTLTGRVYDTILIGSKSFVPEVLIDEVIKKNIPGYIRTTPIEPLITNLICIKVKEKFYYVVYVNDASMFMNIAPSDIVFLFDQNFEILYTYGEADIFEKHKFYGDFDEDGLLDIIMWEYGNPKVLSVGNNKVYPNENIRVEIIERVKRTTYEMKIIGNSKVNRALININLQDTVFNYIKFVNADR